MCAKKGRLEATRQEHPVLHEDGREEDGEADEVLVQDRAAEDLKKMMEAV